MKRALHHPRRPFLAAPAAASACSCVRTGNPGQELRDAGAAAFTKITKRKVVGASGPYAFNNDIRYTLKVIRDYKKNLPSKITIEVPRSSATCGIDAPVGRKLGLLLGRRANGKYETSLCSIRSRKHLENGARQMKAKQASASAAGSACAAA